MHHWTPRSETPWRGIETTPKTANAYRVINIDKDLALTLRQHIADRTSGQLFTTAHGALYQVNYARKVLKTLLKKLQIPDGGLHAFRHGRVSLLQASRVPRDLVEEWIGHSSLRNTTSRYTHWGAEFKEEIVNTLSPKIVPSGWAN